MDNNVLEEDKSFANKKDNVGLSRKPITLSSIVSSCLGTHKRCSGYYTDNKGEFLLRCNCECHKGNSVRSEDSDI